MVLVSGYVFRKSISEICADGNWKEGVTTDCYEKYKKYFDAIDKGALQKPSDNIFSILCVGYFVSRTNGCGYV